MIMRKAIVFAIVACIGMVCITGMASAAVNEPDVKPMATCYRSAYAKIGITDNGTATVKGSITGYAGTTTKTSVHLYLQKYKNEKWTAVADWTSTQNASSCTLSKSKSVAKGKYRVKVVCKAYMGTKCETVTKYSSATY